MDIREHLKPFCPDFWNLVGLIKEDGAWHINTLARTKLPDALSVLLDHRVSHIHAEVEFIRVDFESSRVLWYGPGLHDRGMVVVDWQLSEHETMLLLSSDPHNFPS